MVLTDLCAQELSQAIHGRQVSCRDVMAATLARIESLNPVYNAIVSLRAADTLLAEADACDAQLKPGKARGPVGWMHGMPQAIKDLSPTAGIATTLGSPLLRTHTPALDGLMVQRMKAAGCIVIGKTNTPEFGLGSHTFNPVFGITRNAYDPTRSAGGSSGGAAVALAQRMLAVADGSDFMGSLRNPAAWNNVFGMRPSSGRVPLWPVPENWVSHMGTEGPMARTVQDLALLLAVQAGYDARVPLSLDDAGIAPRSLDAFDATGVRIGWLGDLRGHLALESGILETCERALARLQDLGCHVQPMAPGFAPEEVWQDWIVLRHWLVAARITPLLRVAGNRERIKPEALWECEQAALLTAADVMAASVGRTAYYERMLALFDQCDFLALPAAQVWPFDAAERWPVRIGDRTMDTYHRWMEVAIYATFGGLPCISVPAGFGPTGLPMGLQIMGPPRADMALLRVAHAYERAAQDVVRVRPPA